MFRAYSHGIICTLQEFEEHKIDFPVCLLAGLVQVLLLMTCDTAYSGSS